MVICVQRCLTPRRDGAQINIIWRNGCQIKHARPLTRVHVRRKDTGSGWGYDPVSGRLGARVWAVEPGGTSGPGLPEAYGSRCSRAQEGSPAGGPAPGRGCPRTSGLDQQDKHDGRQALGGGLAETQGVTRGRPRGAGFPGLWSTEAVSVWEAEATVSSPPATLVRMIGKQH